MSFLSAIAVLLLTEAVSATALRAFSVVMVVLIGIHLFWGRRVMRRNRPN